jgi:DNA-binding CsgD family transcriptional regulator
MLEATHRLSERELQVVRLVIDGLTDQEIGRALAITTRTAQAHVVAARSKLRARSRTHLAVLALRTGLVPLDPS